MSTIEANYVTQSALSSGLAGKADSNTELISGSYSNGTLTLNKISGNIKVNGFSDFKEYELVTSGDITQFISGDIDVNISENFIIQYIYNSTKSGIYVSNEYVLKGNFKVNDTTAMLAPSYRHSSDYFAINRKSTGWGVIYYTASSTNSSEIDVIYDETVPINIYGCYRLFA